MVHQKHGRATNLHGLVRSLVFGLLLLAGTAAAASGKVVSVSDGDTVKVLLQGNRQVKVRLWGIDAPESGQAFGKNAKRALAELVAGQLVDLDEKGRDRYGRTLATVQLQGVNVNEEMVRLGWAWWYRNYAPEAKALEAAEIEARAAGRGLWADKGGVPPWEWRAQKRGK